MRILICDDEKTYLNTLQSKRQTSLHLAYHTTSVR